MAREWLFCCTWKLVVKQHHQKLIMSKTAPESVEIISKSSKFSFWVFKSLIRTLFGYLKMSLFHDFIRKVVSSNTSRLEPHPHIKNCLWRGFFDAYVLWPFGKKFIFELVTRVKGHLILKANCQAHCWSL